MRSRTGRDLEIPPQDRCSCNRINLFEVHGLATPVPEDSPTVCGRKVPHPARVLSKHRYEVALALEVGYHDRNRDDAAAAPPPNLERRGTLWQDPSGKGHGCTAVLQS